MVWDKIGLELLIILRYFVVNWFTNKSDRAKKELDTQKTIEFYEQKWTVESTKQKAEYASLQDKLRQGEYKI